MDTETTDVILSLLNEVLSKQKSSTYSTYVTVGGMLGVALIGAYSQWQLTKKLVKSEREKIQLQLNAELHLRQKEAWQEAFREVIAQLLKETDPEIHSMPNKEKVISLIHKAQLMLNPSVKTHSEINNLINQLGLTVTGWIEDHDVSGILNIHSQLVDFTRSVLFQPSR